MKTRILARLFFMFPHVRSQVVRTMNLQTGVYVKEAYSLNTTPRPAESNNLQRIHISSSKIQKKIRLQVSPHARVQEKGVVPRSAKPNHELPLQWSDDQ